MKTNLMSQAEKMRYGKIVRLTNLLCGENVLPLDYSVMDGLDKPFNVGKRITIEGQNININKKPYCALDIKKVTINTEGSMAVYDRSGKKLCGWSVLNLSSHNIELFCLWARKNKIPSEIVSGKAEKAFQMCFLAFAVLAVVLIRLLRAVA